MKKTIAALITISFLQSTAMAGWVDQSFDLSAFDFRISGHVRYTPNGLDTSRTKLTIFGLYVKARHDTETYPRSVGIGVSSFPQAEGKRIWLDDLICQKMGYSHGSSNQKSTDSGDVIAFLNADLTIREVYNPSSGYSVYDDIECSN